MKEWSSSTSRHHVSRTTPSALMSVTSHVTVLFGTFTSLSPTFSSVVSLPSSNIHLWFGVTNFMEALSEPLPNVTQCMDCLP